MLRNRGARGAGVSGLRNIKGVMPVRIFSASLRTLAKGRIATFLCAAAATLILAGNARAETSIEAVDRGRLRVCADPDNLPYSNEKGEGFENKIAELFAKKLKRPLVYSWSPLGAGFFPNTLDAKTCDLVMGVPSALEAVLSTNPYYRMTYVMVTRKNLKAKSLSDPEMAKLKIGTIAGTPPNYLLLDNNLLGNLVPYRLHNDPGEPTIAEEMIGDLKKGTMDAALLAGPAAYYWVRKERVDAEITRLENAKHSGGKMDYLITMGVRRGESDWKREINDLIRKNQAEINNILASYGVPILNLVGSPEPAGTAQGKPSPASPASAASPASPASPAAPQESPAAPKPE